MLWGCVGLMSLALGVKKEYLKIKAQIHFVFCCLIIFKESVMVTGVCLSEEGESGWGHEYLAQFCRS